MELHSTPCSGIKVEVGEYNKAEAIGIRFSCYNTAHEVTLTPEMANELVQQLTKKLAHYGFQT